MKKLMFLLSVMAITTIANCQVYDKVKKSQFDSSWCSPGPFYSYVDSVLVKNARTIKSLLGHFHLTAMMWESKKEKYISTIDSLNTAINKLNNEIEKLEND